MQLISGAWISRGSGQEHLTDLCSPVLSGASGCGSFYMAVDGIEIRVPSFCNVNQLFDANSEQHRRSKSLSGPLQHSMVRMLCMG
ncbi:MAG: iron complex outermembrane receptor protein [Flavobacteriales bacterium]|jgi:iron complex outermembrane receptor protein